MYGVLKQANFYFWLAYCGGLAWSLFPGTWFSRSLSSAMKKFLVCWQTTVQEHQEFLLLTSSTSPKTQLSWRLPWLGTSGENHFTMILTCAYCLFSNHIFQSINIKWEFQGHYSVKAAIGTRGFLTSLKSWLVGAAFDFKPFLADISPEFSNVSGIAQLKFKMSPMHQTYTFTEVLGEVPS